MKALQGVLALVIFLFAAAGLTMLTGEQSARADGGPHGGYGATGGPSAGLPDQCAGCHRVHQGQSVGKLLKASSPYALCLTCHNGSGSNLDVYDGVKLAAKIGQDASVVRSADSPNLTVSVAPSADLYMPAGGDGEFTLALRNRSGSPALVAVAVTSESNVGAGATQFTASTVSASSITIPAASGSVPGVAYLDVFTHSKATNVETNQNLTTVTVSFGAETPAVVVQSRVGGAPPNVLNGGGFAFVNGQPVTSRHNADPADNSLRPWGFNSNTGQDTNTLTSPLQCTSCHNPHGTANYRILKESVNSNTVNVKAFFSGAFTKDEGAAGLTAGAPADKYVDEYYGSVGGGGAPTSGGGSLASLCGACHTAYPSGGASDAYSAGGVTHYRHKTEMTFSDWSNPDSGRISQNPETTPVAGFPALRLASNAGVSDGIVTCLTCHRVHGTNTTMDGYALKGSLGGLADEDLSPAQTTTSRTTLLFTNNRGMCQACHQWGVP